MAQSEANFELARQDLILRVAQAYFDVLNAGENLQAVQTNKAAIAQQLELAKKSFEVGTATITDSHEAQARYDLASAQEIAAESDLEVKRRALQAIVGNEPGVLAALRKEAELSPAQPADMAQWVSAAEKDSYNVQVQRALADIAEREVNKQRAGHYPTVNLVADQGRGKSYFGGNLIDTDFARMPGSRSASAVPGRRPGFASARSGGQPYGSAGRARSRSPRRSTGRPPVLSRRGQRPGPGQGAEGGAGLVAIGAGIEQARLRSRRAHQHRCVERRESGL